MKKTLCASLMSAMLTFTAGSAFAADAPNWPTRPVQVVVIANPGGDTDFNARMMAKYFNQITGKTMVVTNVAGGGGTLAAEQVKGAAADGNSMAAQSAVRRKGWRRPVCFIAATSVGSLLSPGIFPDLPQILGCPASPNN